MGTLFRLTKDSVTPAGRILKAADVAVLLEANTVLEQAQERADAILKQAEEAYETRRQEGYRDGQEEGRLEHAEKVFETVLSSVEYLENLEQTIVEVVTSSIRKVIGEMDDREVIVRIVRNALVFVRNQQRVTIRVAPADEAAVREAMAAMLQGSPSTTSFLDVVADGRLERGACLLESELGVVDASLSTQLRALNNAFHAKIQAQG